MSSKDRFRLIPSVYLLLRSKGKILLLRRANTGYQDGTYSLIAGHLDGDELGTEGMIREAREEAGITVLAKDLRLVHTAHRLSRNQVGQERVDLFFEATKWEGKIVNNEPEKWDDLSWFDVDNLPHQMLPFIRLVIEDVENGINYSEYTEEPK